MKVLVAALISSAPEQIAPVRLPPTITIEQLRYITAMASLQVFTALLIHLTILLGFLILISVIMRWQRTALLLFVLFGTAVLLIPSGYCLYYGLAIAAVACVGLGLSFFRKTP